MSQRSPQQLKAQRRELALATAVWNLFPYGHKPYKKLRKSTERGRGEVVEVKPDFQKPSASEMEAAERAVSGFQSVIRPIPLSGAIEILLGDRNLYGDRRDVTISYKNGETIAFDPKGSPGNLNAPQDITSPRSKAMFEEVGSPWLHLELKEREEQVDKMLDLLKRPQALNGFLNKILGEYNYYVVDLARENIYPWGPSLKDKGWEASKSEVEFKGEEYPSIKLYSPSLRTSIEVCPRRKDPRNLKPEDTDFKWHVTASGELLKSYGRIEKPEDLF